MKKLFPILFVSLFIFSCNKDRNPIGTETDVCSGEYIELWGNYLDVNTITEIDLGLTGLIGVIPQHIGCFENLTYLNLSNNYHFTGSIPPEIGNLTNLTYLDLRYNQLTGSIPPEIGNLINLENLRLSYNDLTGNIPEEVCNLIESNNLDINDILNGNDLINTCED